MFIVIFHVRAWFESPIASSYMKEKPQFFLEQSLKKSFTTSAPFFILIQKNAWSLVVSKR